jgi:hypothetical protein
MEVPAQDVTVHIPAETVGTGYEIVTEDIIANPSYQTTTVTVNAPTGKKVISCGVEFTPNSGFAGGPFKNRPSDDGSSWIIEATISAYPHPTGFCGTAYVVCISV